VFTLPPRQRTHRSNAVRIGSIHETVSVGITEPLLKTVSAGQHQSADTARVAEVPPARRDCPRILDVSTEVGAGNGTFRMNGIGEAGTNYSVDETGSIGNTGACNFSTFGDPGYISAMSLGTRGTTECLLELLGLKNHPKCD